MWWRVTCLKCPAPSQAARSRVMHMFGHAIFIHISEEIRNKGRSEERGHKETTRHTLMQDNHEGALIKAVALDKESGSEPKFTQSDPPRFTRRRSRDLSFVG